MFARSLVDSQIDNWLIIFQLHTHGDNFLRTLQYFQTGLPGQMYIHDCDIRLIGSDAAQGGITIAFFEDINRFTTKCIFN